MKTFLFFIAGIITVSVYAQPGSPDKSFGNNGVVLDTNFLAYCYTMAIQPDGKILTGCNGGYVENPGSSGLCVARYNSNGSIDESFGENGKFIAGEIPGAKPQAVKDIEVLPDGKILACGYFTIGPLYSHPGLLRLFSDGRIDSSFGTNGFVITKLSEWGDAIAGMAVQPDGKIIVAGNKYVADLQPGPDFLLRFLPDGRPDESFGENGQVFTYYTANVHAGALLLQPDGKMVVGDVYGSATKQFQLTRYNTDGTLDLGFGVNGIARIKPVSSFLGKLNSLTLQNDGKIIATGLYNFGPSMAVARFTAGGTTDSAFGNLGLGYTYFYTPNVYAEAKNVFVTKDKKILLTGLYGKSTAEQVAALQYNNNGIIDSSFGENGLATGGFPESEYGSYLSSGVGLLQPDGKIIVSGSFYQDDDGNLSLALFRFNGDLSKKQILIAKIRRWLQHHNGIVWDNLPGANSYAVQRSSNGVAWSTVYRQQSTVNSQRSTANSYIDPNPLPGTNYYRLETTSVDGAVAYSNVVAISNEPSAISISPNPARSVLRIEGLPSSAKTKITVVDFAGNVAISQQLEPVPTQSGANSPSSHNLNISSLKPGNYLLRIESEGNVVTKQFVKD